MRESPAGAMFPQMFDLLFVLSVFRFNLIFKIRNDHFGLKSIGPGEPGSVIFVMFWEIGPRSLNALLHPTFSICWSKITCFRLYVVFFLLGRYKEKTSHVFSADLSGV